MDVITDALAIIGALVLLAVVLIIFTPSRHGRVRGRDLPRKENGTIDFDRLGRSSDSS
jgi:hypothetical protein